MLKIIIKIKLLFLLVFIFLMNIRGYGQVQILAYHPSPIFGFTEEMFKSHINFLKDNGYNTITLDDLTSWTQGKQTLQQRSIIISFDDGYLEVYKICYPILKSKGFKGINFINTDYIGLNSRLTWSQMKEMEGQKVIFTESHGRTHADLTYISPSQAKTEILGSKLIIDKQLNKNSQYIAYPFGAFGNDVIRICKDSNLSAGFGYLKGDGLNYPDTPPFEFERISVDNIDIDTFKKKIKFNEINSGILSKYKENQSDILNDKNM